MDFPGKTGVKLEWRDLGLDSREKQFWASGKRHRLAHCGFLRQKSQRKQGCPPMILHPRGAPVADTNRRAECMRAALNRRGVQRT